MYFLLYPYKSNYRGECSHASGQQQISFFVRPQINEEVTKVKCQIIIRVWFLHQTDSWPPIVVWLKDKGQIITVVCFTGGVNGQRHSLTPDFVNPQYELIGYDYLAVKMDICNYGHIMVYDEWTEEEILF